MSRDIVEIYEGDAILVSSETSIVPPVGSLISIRKRTYEVVRITYAVDGADDWAIRRMRCNIDVKKAKK